MYINESGKLIHPDCKTEEVLGIYSIGTSSSYCKALDYLFFSTELPF